MMPKFFHPHVWELIDRIHEHSDIKGDTTIFVQRCLICGKIKKVRI